MTGQNSKPTVIWRLTDGRPGHDTQSKGLVRSLEQITKCHCQEISVHAFNHKIFNLLSGKFPPGKKLADPDLIIGAGHSTHIPIICAKHARGGKTIIIMKPSLPCSWFDYCIIPDHDNPPTRENIIITRGVINSVRSTSDHNGSKGLILIGGPSKHHSWNLDGLINQLDEIVKNNPTIQWTLTDSPRTPPATSEMLASLHWPTVNYLPFPECNTATLPELYATCGTIWVSEDSVSMVYEALTSGARVGLLSIPGAGKSRVSNAINNLVSANEVTSYENWINTKTMNIPPDNFNESDRCAEFIYQHAIDK